MNKANQVSVSVIMGSSSDWEQMKEACAILEEFEISYEKQVISAHRMPNEMLEFAAKAKSRGIKVIIAGAGGAAHLPGMVASNTTLPVIGVPIKTSTLNGMDSLLSIIQMPGGVPVATMAIGKTGAKNAGLTAVRILALHDSDLTQKMIDFMANQNQAAHEMSGDLHD